MIYEYECTKCQCHFDVVKPVKDIDINEFCEKCGNPAERIFVPSKVYFSGEKVTHAEYNPAFGCVIKNKRHRDDLAKERGMIEIGNDFKSSANLHNTQEAKLNEKLKKKWEDV